MDHTNDCWALEPNGRPPEDAQLVDTPEYVAGRKLFNRVFRSLLGNNMTWWLINASTRAEWVAAAKDLGHVAVKVESNR